MFPWVQALLVVREQSNTVAFCAKGRGTIPRPKYLIVNGCICGSWITVWAIAGWNASTYGITVGSGIARGGILARIIYEVKIVCIINCSCIGAIHSRAIRGIWTGESITNRGVSAWAYCAVARTTIGDTGVRATIGAI